MPVPTGVIRRNPLIKAIEDRLNNNLPDTTPETMGYLSKPVDVPLLDVHNAIVQRYWVLHPFHGLPPDEQDLADTGVDLEWTFQVTAAAGISRDCYAIASDIDALLYRWAPVVAGLECGPLHPPAGYDAGPARPDTSVKPDRFFLPLQYRTTITRANA